MTEALDLKLSKDRNLEEFLKVTVETTRTTLKCDRVIVYNASELPRALVLAESVDAEYSSILGKIIKDPFLEDEYLEMYRYGMPAVINDIYTADLSQSDLEELQKLGIKSLVIAPISVENQLLALLVAHQCSNVQSWNSEAIYFLIEKANAVGFALSKIANTQKQQDANFNKSEEKKSEEAEGLQGLQAPETVVMSAWEAPRQSDLINSGNSPLSSEVASEVDTPRPSSDKSASPGETSGGAFQDSNSIQVSAPCVDDRRSEVFLTNQTAETHKNQNSPTMELKETTNSEGNIQPTEQITAIQENGNSSFSEVMDQIANERRPEDILNTTVKEVRHLLNCDRVVVYSLNRDSYGLVIAESVANGWSKALGKTIDDPCFAARYLEKYRQGRVRAWDTIYCEDATPCYLEQLESLEVKAKIVAPIINEGQLFGLLIAHQCADTRNWQEQEINWITQIATQTGIMLEYNKIIDETAQEEQQKSAEIDSKWNQNFTDAIQYIRQSLKKEDILKASVKEVRRILNCDRVVIYSMNQDNYGMIVAESVAAAWTRSKGMVINDPCFEARYLDQYRNGRVRAWSNIYESGLTQCYIDQLEQLQVKANLVTPIINEGKLFGLLVSHQCSDFREWQQPEIRWTAQIATQVGFALDNAKLLADSVQLQQELENEAKLTKYFTDATRYIRESLDQEDILDISVDEVRRVLECDRVVVYSMNQNNYGTVISESVAPGWTRALGKRIDDPCFKATYQDQYRNGRVRAWSNIYESGMTSCYIEMLEKLEVKANLVTPIVNEGKLFGLLVAHQCSGFRQWQQPEIRWVTQVATQVGFALDNAKLLVNSKQLQQQVEEESKWTDYFTDVLHHIRQSLTTEDILQTSVREVRRILECDRVVVYSLNRNFRYGTVLAESVAPGWTRALGKKIDDPCFEPSYRKNYLDGRARAWNNIREAGMSPCYIDQLEKLEVKANLVAPVINEGKLFGLLVSHQCSETRNWQQAEIRWVAQIATQVGFALDNAKLLVGSKQLQRQVEDETKWTEYFTDAVQHIRQSLTTKDILKTSVQEVRRILECDRVVIYSLSQDTNGMVIAESVASRWTRALGKKINDPCFEPHYKEKYLNGRVRAWSNIRKAGMSSCYIEQLEKLEVKANLVAPVINEGKLFGLLVAHQCSNTRQWQQLEIRWVAQIATQVGFALDNAQLLGRLEESTKTSDRVSHQQYEQTETLKHQLVEILAENGDAYQTLSQEAMRQSETTIKVLHQIQEVADSFNTIALNTQQVKLQKQQNDLAVQSTQESLDRAVNSISNIQSTVQHAAVGFDNLSHSCQKLSETVKSIKDLSKQIVQQSMSITRAVNRSQIDQDNQNSLIDLSDSIFSVMQELFEATAKVEPLFANLKTEVREKTIALDSGTQKLISGVEEFQTVRHKLDRVVTLNNKMSPLVENISNSVENQLQSSTFAKDSVQEVASIAERISEQSMSIAQSFNKLVGLVQKL